MSDIPIIFSAPMVRAIIDGRKTQTRRIVKNRRALDYLFIGGAPEPGEPVRDRMFGFAPGDRLWVREAFKGATGYDGLPPSKWGNKPVWYCADGDPDPRTWWHLSSRAHPSIHMPRWMSRILLHVTGVKVELLNTISRADAIAEGCESPLIDTEAPSPAPGVFLADERTSFAQLWNRIHGVGSWAANPWVVAITFTCDPTSAIRPSRET